MSIEISEDARLLVKRGAEVLDLNVHAPSNWRQFINTDELDIPDGDSCVLGQVFGSYGRGVDELDLFGHSAEYGFDLPYTGDWDVYSNRTAGYEELTEAWKEYLA